MLKRLWLLAGLLSLVTTSAFGAGTVPGFSLSIQYDNSGNLARGCKLYVIQASTTSAPQIAYQDSALTIPAVGGSILTCDGSGRLPQFFLADGQIKLRLTDKNGVQIFSQDNLLVVGPSSGGGGGGGSVDPTTIAATGDLKVSYGTSVLSGWVRANGRTIGSASSGATERANSDTQALFVYLWGADANLAVSGGRGANAAADYAANKTIALPDWRGRTLAGLDDMGNSAAGRLTATYFGAGATTLGGVGSSSESTTLVAAQIPTITASGSNTISVTSSIKYIGNTAGNSGSAVGGGTQLTASDPGSGAVLNNVSSSGSNSIAVTSTNTSGQPHRTVQPTMLATIYVKL